MNLFLPIMDLVIIDSIITVRRGSDWQSIVGLVIMCNNDSIITVIMGNNGPVI